MSQGHEFYPHGKPCISKQNISLFKYKAKAEENATVDECYPQQLKSYLAQKGE